MELLSEDHSDTSSTQDMSHSTITTIKSSLVAHEMKEFGLIHNPYNISSLHDTTTQSSKGGPPPRSSPMTTRAADRFRHVAHPQGTYYPKFIAT
jgi:hypothetical protein